MADKQAMADKQYLAKILFINERLTQKEIAKRLSVSEPTISDWVNKFNWRELRTRMLLSKPEQLANMYEQLEALNEEIKKSPNKRPDTKQADVQIKITTSIRALENDLAIADLVESGKRFIKHLQRTNSFEVVKGTTLLWNDFLQDELAKKNS